MGKELTDASEGTACHDVAKSLMVTLSVGPVLFSGTRTTPVVANAAQLLSDQTLLQGAATVITANPTCCIRVRTHYHSFVLIKCSGLVESIEAWAGGNGVSFAYSLDECLASALAPCTSDQCVAAIGQLLDPGFVTRNAAFARLSRAGLQYYTDVAIQILEIEIRPLKSQVQFSSDTTAVLEYAAKIANDIANDPEVKKQRALEKKLKRMFS